jgi:hypothetical protein
MFSGWIGRYNGTPLKAGLIWLLVVCLLALFEINMPEETWLESNIWKWTKVLVVAGWVIAFEYFIDIDLFNPLQSNINFAKEQRLARWEFGLGLVALLIGVLACSLATRFAGWISKHIIFVASFPFEAVVSVMGILFILIACLTLRLSGWKMTALFEFMSSPSGKPIERNVVP